MANTDFIKEYTKKLNERYQDDIIIEDVYFKIVDALESVKEKLEKFSRFGNTVKLYDDYQNDQHILEIEGHSLYVQRDQYQKQIRVYHSTPFFSEKHIEIISADKESGMLYWHYDLDHTVNAYLHTAFGELL